MRAVPPSLPVSHPGHSPGPARLTLRGRRAPGGAGRSMVPSGRGAGSAPKAGWSRGARGGQRARWDRREGSPGARSLPLVTGCSPCGPRLSAPAAGSSLFHWKCEENSPSLSLCAPQEQLRVSCSLHPSWSSPSGLLEDPARRVGSHRVVDSVLVRFPLIVCSLPLMLSRGAGVPKVDPFGSGLWG